MALRRDASPIEKALEGALIGYVAGEIANELYRGCTPSQKQTWRKRMPMHHGELGCYLASAGMANDDPFFKGLGAGLIVSDADDAKKWFKKCKRSR